MVMDCSVVGVCSIVSGCASFLWHPFLDGVSAFGTFVMLALTAHWTLFALRCRRARLSGGCVPQQPSALPDKLPSLSVITPIKGVHVESMDNWRSVVETEYDGDIEFIFVVESDDDPAYAPLKQLQNEALTSCSKNLKGVKVAVAGMGFHCSQKIHNMLEGVSMVDRESKYVLFLDDDVGLYRTTFRDLVMEIEADDKVFVATGFPYDWMPSKDVPFPSYLKLVYRWTSLLLLYKERPPVVWGGCMLMRREDLHSNRYGMMEAWRSRGYSDDMIVGSVCVKEGRAVALPATCIFPHKLGSHDNFGNYWNFSCRQMFVLDTYHNSTERLQNYILLFVVSGLLPSVTVFSLAINCARSFAWVCHLAHVVNSCAAPCELPGSIHLLVAAWVSYVFVFLAIRETTLQALGLLNFLLPSRAQIPVVTPCMFRGVAAFIVHHAILPLAAVFGFLSSKVVWSGVTYTVNKGRITSVSRMTPEGKILTRPAEESLEDAKARHGSRGFLRSGKASPSNFL
eukprot:CAMPEP_0114548520 /NCGR_PEP_ID=MMETSP0114-20121206/5026_1 /TAXON_ID=31324 /ORGANISM="Goniomonas sp, Strain m" /LENGTH=510 /DNA_ID=CAMNT_0001733117 /DNA_START=26 /DNA_END=1558 /DNA_ORIENTATION=-